MKGKRAVDVWWDFPTTYGNGAVVKVPHTCQKVKDGGSEKVTIPIGKLTGVDKCAATKVPTARLENLTLNGKPTENR